jgi:hypothetical protein
MIPATSHDNHGDVRSTSCKPVIISYRVLTKQAPVMITSSTRPEHDASSPLDALPCISPNAAYRDPDFPCLQQPTIMSLNQFDIQIDYEDDDEYMEDEEDDEDALEYGDTDVIEAAAEDQDEIEGLQEDTAQAVNDVLNGGVYIYTENLPWLY